MEIEEYLHKLKCNCMQCSYEVKLKLNWSAVTVCICISKTYAIYPSIGCSKMSFRIECESMATDIKINVIVIVSFIIANDIPPFSALIDIIRSNSIRFVSIRLHLIRSNLIHTMHRRVQGNKATCHNIKSTPTISKFSLFPPSSVSYSLFILNRFFFCNSLQISLKYTK